MSLYKRRDETVTAALFNKLADDPRAKAYDSKRANESCSSCNRRLGEHAKIETVRICPGWWIVNHEDGVRCIAPTIFNIWYKRVV